MQHLTPAAQHAVQQLSQRFGVSTGAVETLLDAVNAGGGSMAQFYHPELGGGGQWMRGGMTMVGDMFNGHLQGTVAGLCSALSELLATTQVYPPPPAGGGAAWGSTSWWPSELGQPNASGGQNDMRYAYFAGPRRLALQRQGQVTVYDTLDHQIGGVQQQGYPNSLSFSSQYGTFGVESLPQISPAPAAPQVSPYPAEPSAAPNLTSQVSTTPAANEIIQTLERLGQLMQSGVLTEEEFRAKKAELLGRL